MAWTIALCGDPQPRSVGMEVATVEDEAAWGQMKRGGSIPVAWRTHLVRIAARQAGGRAHGPGPFGHSNGGDGDVRGMGAACKVISWGP